MSKLTKEDLYNHLWAAADILRGSIDSSDYKVYIFGFLFLKRLSDRFEEEAKNLIKDGLPEDVAWEDPDEHQFFVPKRARWSTLITHAENIGEKLDKAAEALEEANPSIEGVLVNISFNSEARLGDQANRDTVLGQLVRHFSKVSLTNENLAEPDILGRAYEYLIDKFADDAGKKGGEFYTPHTVVSLLVRLIDPEEGMRICDPTCGSGGMLIQSAERVLAKQGRKLGQGGVLNLTLHGQEKNLGTWAIAKMNLLLHNLPDAKIEKGDTIRNPQLLDNDGALMLYDRVIANPPFSLDNWGAGDIKGKDGEKDKWGRFPYGLPPKNAGDLAFVQHMLATLKTDGRAAIVMPHGVLFRGSGDGRIRKGMLKDDVIEAVIGLPENLFAGTGIPAAVLMLNRAKPAERKKKVLFIHAAREYEPKPKKNILSDDNIKSIKDAWDAWLADPNWPGRERFARVVDFTEIEENEFNLNISRYVDTLEPEEPLDVAAAVSALREAEKARDKAAERMDSLLKEMGYAD
jgi:type I restriction enzyme M protein